VYDQEQFDADDDQVDLCKQDPFLMRLDSNIMAAAPADKPEARKEWTKYRGIPQWPGIEC
jgi:hypothetical protein